MAPTITNTQISSTTKSKSSNKYNVNTGSSLSKSTSSSSKIPDRKSNIRVNTSQKAKSEIDSIFSLTHTVQQRDVGLSSAVEVNGESFSGKKKRKKGKDKDKEETVRKENNEEEEWSGFGNDEVSKHNSMTIRKVETIVDPSSVSSFNPKKRKRDVLSSTTKAKTQEDSERFQDSRGTGPRRRTEEGYGIYKEDELGISEGGGDNAREL
ncbi:hypothetical protein Clacol_005146 [Clathrus columnatus]|uniref:Uncharacterized protein n=1 Tax=Clathrus columnatus TaxID=1419009 RepID=A0AAV5ABF7_9AGAM|nr:hypothetical protein Clacol_005146 [Clathrus columnatus]